MANAFKITNAVAKALADAFTAANDAGTAAVIQIYAADGDGVPAQADDAITNQTLLGTLTMSATSFPAATDGNPGGLLTANAIASDTSADATGTAAFFRIVTQVGGTTIAQGTVGTAACDLNLNTTAITAGSTIAITSMTITMPEA